MEGGQPRLDDGDSSLITDSSITCSDTDRLIDDQAFYLSLNQQRLEKRNTNIVIECNGSVYPAHNYVMACRSNYFYKKFCWEESGTTGSNNTAVLNEYHPSVIETIIDFIYTNNFDLCKISDEKLEMLFLCGRSLEVVGFEASLLKALVSNLKPSNFHLSLILAKQINDIGAQAKVLSFVCDNLTTIWSSPEFAALDEEHLHYIFQHCSNVLTCHDILLDSLLRWVKRDIETREDSLARLLTHINFNKITRATATSALYNRLVYSKPPLKDEILSVIKRESNDEYSDESQNESTPVELPNAVQTLSAGCAAPALFFIGRSEQNSATSLTYDVNADEWYRPCDLEISLAHRPGIGYDGQNIFFLGGTSVNDCKQTSCILYNFSNRAIHALPDMRIAREKPLVFTFDGTIYALGGSGRYSSEGLSHGEYLSSLYTTVWKVMQPMRAKRNGLATACVFNSYIYVAGGGTGQVERYLTSQKTWDLLSPVSEDAFLDGNVHLSAASGRVYAMRFYKPNFILAYNHERSNWESDVVRGTPPEFVSHTVGWGSKIFTLDKENRIFILDTAAYMWFELGKVPQKSLAYPCYMNIV